MNLVINLAKPNNCTSVWVIFEKWKVNCSDKFSSYAEQQICNRCKSQLLFQIIGPPDDAKPEDLPDPPVSLHPEHMWAVLPAWKG